MATGQQHATDRSIIGHSRVESSAAPLGVTSEAYARRITANGSNLNVQHLMKT
jgi:hypothetical protein